MAQKYVVQAKDNPLTLAKKFETSPQAILQNNAIKSLTAGQTIKIPSTGFQTPTTNGFTAPPKPNLTTTPATNANSGGINAPRYFAPTGSFLSGGGNTALSVAQPTAQPTQAQGSFVSGGGQVNMTGQRTGFQTPTTNGFTSQQLTGGSFYSGSGEINLTGVVPGGGSGGGSNNSYSRPTGIYTGGNSANDIAWRNYWNYSAANPSSVESPVSTYMPTRNDIWERKAAQRRRAAESNDGGGSNGYQYQSPQSIGNNVVGGSWRVG